MTGPGIVQVSPSDMRSMARGFRNADWHAGNPPTVVDADWNGVQDWHDAVDDANQHHRHRHHDRADRVDGATDEYVGVDDQNAQQVGAVGKGLDASGAGAIMSSLLQPTGQVISGLGQGFNALLAGSEQAIAQELGQITNVGGQVTAANVKADHPAAGLSAGVDGGKDDKGQAGTQPAAASSPLGRPSTGGQPTSPQRPGGYVRHDGDDTTVQPAGMSMPGMAGLGGAAAGGGQPGAPKPPVRYPIAYGPTKRQDDDPTPPPPAVDLAPVIVGPKEDHDRANT